MNGKQIFGRAAEQKAIEHLERLGYRLIEQNWRTKFGEIDLIMEDGSALVFVEVKARRSNTFGSAVEALTGAKQHKLVKLAQIYITMHRRWHSEFRIDFVSIQVESGVYQIEHYKNIVGAFD